MVGWLRAGLCFFALVVGSGSAMGALCLSAVTNSSELTGTARLPNPVSPKTYYENAFKFASLFGKQFAEASFRHAGPGKTVFAIAHRGAEPLGLLLEAYAEMNQLQNAVFVPLYLSTDVVGTSPFLNSGAWANSGNNSEADIVRYIIQQNVFSADKVVVIDTAFKGTIAQVVAHAAHLTGYERPVEGFLLYKGKTATQSRCPVSGFNLEGLPPADGDEDARSKALRWWAEFIDEGYAPGDFTGRRYGLGFQKSRLPISDLIDRGGLLYPNHPPFNQEVLLERFEATRLGLRHGLGIP